MAPEGRQPRVLGAVLAGGRSRRFGSDKALALLAGRKLIDHVATALGSQCDDVVICGRPGGLPDRPTSDLGPLGGLAAALHDASDRGFELVLSAPCDVPRLPIDLFARLMWEGTPAYLATSPVIGLWPSRLAGNLSAYLAEAEDRSMRRWVAHCCARPLHIDTALANINTPTDLDAYRP